MSSLKSPKGIRWTILVTALLIGAFSIVYVRYLTVELKERERQQISLYAKTLELFSNNQMSEKASFFFDDIIVNNTSIPVILTDEYGEPQDSKNVRRLKDIKDLDVKKRILYEELEAMRVVNEPLLITLKTPNMDVIGYRYVFYNNSFLLDQLIYFPYIQVSLIFVLLVITFMMFNYSKTSEQNKVWAGLAKETAHQLGTPLSSLMAWNDYIGSTDDFDRKEISNEMSKDISRLNLIAERFSNIGSVPVLRDLPPGEIIENVVGYLRKRTSQKVVISIEDKLDEEQKAAINKPLFEWVIENLIKNAIDAMKGQGDINIIIQKIEDRVCVDISDTGKGISMSQSKKIFEPGFTTKQRGWGLGLTLAKRIINNYHKGKISLRSSEANKGATFRISLRASAS